MASAAVFGVSYIMVHMGIKMMYLARYQTLPVMQFSKAYVYLAVVISGLLMIIFQSPIAFRQIRRIMER